MNFRNIFAIGSFAALVTTGAWAVDQSVIDKLTAELAAQGYTHLKLHVGPNRVFVEANGPNGGTELLYDGNGSVLSEGFGDRSGAGSGGGSGSGAQDDRGDDNGAGGFFGAGNDDQGNDDSGNDDGGDDDHGDDRVDHEDDHEEDHGDD